MPDVDTDVLAAVEAAIVAVANSTSDELAAVRQRLVIVFGAKLPSLDLQVDVNAWSGLIRERDSSADAGIVALAPSPAEAALQDASSAVARSSIRARRLAAGLLMKLTELENRNLLPGARDLSDDDLLDAIVAGVPQTNPWVKIIGPVFTAQVVAAKLGITEAAVSKRAKTRHLLRILTRDRRAIYPALQFTYSFNPIPGLHDVLNVLHEGIDDPLTWAQWLRAENDELDGHRAVDLLRRGEVDRVLWNASVTAEAWAA